MEENFDIKQFYDATFPTEDHLHDFNERVWANDFFLREEFKKCTDMAFGILGHLHNLDFSARFLPYEDKSQKSHRSKTILEQYNLNVSTSTWVYFAYALNKLKILTTADKVNDASKSKGDLKDDLRFNSVIIPVIQKYDKLFADYERENGIADSLTKK